MITISDGILTIPEGERFVGFSGDNLHTQKKFFIRTAPESGWLYRLYLTFDDGRHNFFTLPSELIDEGVILTWDVKEEHIFKSGLVNAQIKAFSEDNEVYHTTSDVFVAGKTAEEDEEFLNSNSEFLSFEKRLNELYSKMNDASAKMPFVGANGNWFTYDINSDSYIDSGQSAAAALEDMIIPPEKLDRKYWEYLKSSFVGTTEGLLNMLTEENKVMRIKALKDSSMYYWLGDDDALALKTNEDFFVINLCNGKTYKSDPEGGGLAEISKINDGDINREYLFSEDMRNKYLSLPVSKVTTEEFTVEWFNSKTTQGVYQARSNNGERCVLIVLKPNTQNHLMQIKLSHGKFEYRTCQSDVSEVYFADCWTEWIDLTAVAGLKEKLKVIEADIENIEARLNGVEVVSWKSVQDIVRSGRAAEIFSVGDKFMCEHEQYGLLEWMVIGIDHDTPTDESLSHSLTLELETPIPAVQFDAPEALFSVEAELPTQQYNFVVNGTVVWFRPPAVIPAGACIVFPYYDYTEITDTPLRIYESPSNAEPMLTLTVISGSGGADLVDKCTTNDSGRARYGSSNWMQSAMRQFLNSSADAGKVWTPQSAFDRPPEWVNTTAGFLKGMDKDFLNVIGEVKKPTYVTAFDNGTHDVAENSERFFLPSVIELFGSDYRTNEIREGEPYAYYKDNSANASNSISKDANRVVYYNGKAVYAFLRSACFQSAAQYNHKVCNVHTSGAINSIDACNDFDSTSTNVVIKPCCCIV